MSSGPASISGVLDNLPARDRQGMIFGGPASKVITDVVSKNAELSRNQKDARDPAVLDFELRAKNGQLTPDEAAASRQGITPQEYVASTEAAKTAGGAVGKRIGEVIENGGQAARQTLNTVHEMRDAVTQGGNKLFVGPGSETWLKIKQGAVNAGFISPEDAGLPETEVLSKLNAALATQAVKAFTPRGTQFEVKMQMANNPGLLTSIEGTKKLLSLIEQGTSQNIAVGRLAMNQKNWGNWSDVEDKFYADPKNQIVSPFTGKTMGSTVGGGNAPVVDVPPTPGARRGRDGHWYVDDPKRPGKYLQVGGQ
jgi:hypothetical protein